MQRDKEDIMATLTGYMLCENVESSTPPFAGLEPRVRIVGPLSDISLKYVPSHFAMTLVLCLDNLLENEPHMLRVLFRHNDRVVLETAPINIDSIVGHVSELRGTVLTLGMQNLDLEETGQYHFDIFYNDEKLASLPITIRKEPA
jgi:hypothetical protein